MNMKADVQPYPMTIDWDVPIRMDDGLVLRADVYRPRKEGRLPVLISYGPYGKGLHFEDGYKTAWDIMARDYPDTVANTSNRLSELGDASIRRNGCRTTTCWCASTAAAAAARPA